MRAKVVLALGLAGVLIGMPGAWAKDPPVLPDTPEKIAEFLLKRDVGKSFPERADSPTYDVANRDIPDVIDGILAKRFSCLRSNATGNRDRGWSLYTDILMLALGMGGPDSYREIDGRYVIGFSCRAHSCMEKGLMIFDEKENEFIFSILHFFPWNKPENDTAYIQNGMISVFAPPGYPETNLDALRTIVRTWAKQEHRGLRGETLEIPPIQFYAVDCSANPGSTGRQE